MRYQSKDASIFSAQFAPGKLNFSVFLGSSHPSFVRVLEAKRGEASGHTPGATVTGFARGVFSVHVDSAGRNLAVGCGDRYVSVLKVASAD